MKIFKIQDVGRPPYWKTLKTAINRLPVDRFGRNLGGRHVRHDAVAMVTAVA